MLGPYEKKPAMDEVGQMMGGLAYIMGPMGQLLRAGASVIDIMGVSYGVIGILTALYEREKMGKGQYIIAKLFESTAFLMGQHMAHATLTGNPALPMPKRVSSWAIYDKFETKDGQMVFIRVTSIRQWKRFCDTFGLKDLGTDGRLTLSNDRVAKRSWLIPELEKLFKSLRKDELFL